MKKITDKYGKKIGSVEERGNNYIIRDKYGFKEGTVEKEFLSDNYNIYNNIGEKTGKVEPNILGSGAKIKDKSGKEVGKIVPVPVGGISTGGLIALFVIGIMIYISFDSIPQHFSNAFAIGKPEFFTITISNSIFIMYNIICICIDKGPIIGKKNSFLMTLLYEIMSACIIYIGIWIVIGVIGIATGERILDMLLMVPLGALMYCVSFLIVMIILSIVFSIVVRIKESR